MTYAEYVNTPIDNWNKPYWLDSRHEGKTLREIGAELNQNDPAYIPELERVYLAALLSGGDTSGITAENLLVPRHKIIFSAIMEIRALGISGASGLIALLDGIGLLETIGGLDFIQELTRGASLPILSENLAPELKRLYAERMAA
jgi:hypothetical protein